MTEDIDALLVRYYTWQRSGCPSDIGYPHSDPMARLRGSTIGSVGLSDDEAAWVDGALAKLGTELPALLAILDAYYGKKRSPLSISSMARKGYGTTDSILRDLAMARGFLKGLLCGQDCA